MVIVHPTEATSKSRLSITYFIIYLYDANILWVAIFVKKNRLEMFEVQHHILPPTIAPYCQILTFAF